jgi:hypothetical protein
MFFVRKLVIAVGCLMMLERSVGVVATAKKLSGAIVACYQYLFLSIILCPGVGGHD